MVSEGQNDMFTSRKVAQIAAIFASKSGNTINLMKLIKLMYLSDRESMSRYGLPISFDHLVSMDHGPVLSRTLNLINGAVGGTDGAQWEEWIDDRDRYDVSLRREFSREDLDQLSNADLEVIDSIWRDFGHMDQWMLEDYTHKNCAEWTDPDHSVKPISEQDLLLAVGKGGCEAQGLAEEIRAERDLDRMFASL